MRFKHGSISGSITRLARGDLVIGERTVGERPRRRVGVASGVVAFLCVFCFFGEKDAVDVTSSSSSSPTALIAAFQAKSSANFFRVINFLITDS